MNTKEYFDYLKRDPECSKILCGVYPTDKIPTMRSLSALIVCKTDTSTKSEEHWLVLYINKNKNGKYFDSFGRFSTERFTKYLNHNCVGWIWNERQIQTVITELCGH